LAASGGSDRAAKVVYLFYANGQALPSTVPDACAGKPPPFACAFAPTAKGCQRQIQAYLDRWFADLDVVFTLERPKSGPFYTTVISSGGGAWCQVAPKTAGTAPFVCGDANGGVAYVFEGGISARQTAVVAAHETAHLIGLQHTASMKDLMYRTVCADCDGFLDQDLAVDGDKCGRATQNSHQMLEAALGAWTGGSKPSAFGCTDGDHVAPTVRFLAPRDGAKVGDDFVLSVEAEDDCGLDRV